MNTIKNTSKNKSKKLKPQEVKIKKLEAQLKKESSELQRIKKVNLTFKEIIDDSNICIWNWKINEANIEFSNAYLSMLGYLETEVTDKNNFWTTLINHEDLNEAKVKIIEAFKKKELALEVQFRMKTKFEGWKWIYSKIKIFKPSANKNSLHIIGTNTNITIQLQYEEALRGIQNIMRRIVDTIPDILYVYSMNEEHFTYINERGSQILGYNVDELMSMDKQQYQGIIHPDDLNIYKEGLQKLKSAEDGEINESVYRIKNSTGEYKWLHSRKTIFTRDKKNKTENILGISEDITEKRIVEEALKVSEKQFVKSLLDAVESERRRIARELHGGVIHLLMVSNLRLEVFLKNNQLSSPELNEIKKNISAAGQEIRSIVNALHSFVLDSYGIIEAISQLVREFNELNITQLKYETHGQIDKLDKNIELSIYRIIQEALFNIAKHSKASEASIQIFGRNKTIYIIIEDNGLGFEPADYLTTPPKKASFGLIYMKERSELLAGRFCLESKPGHGTEIHIEIPFIEKV
jgi:PAS domain S-box-containing protein